MAAPLTPAMRKAIEVATAPEPSSLAAATLPASTAFTVPAWVTAEMARQFVNNVHSLYNPRAYSSARRTGGMVLVHVSVGPR